VQTTKDGKPLTLQPKHLVLATGMSGFPNIPQIPGAKDFPRHDRALERVRGRRALARQEMRRRRREHLGARHLRRPGEPRRASDDGAALERDRRDVRSAARIRLGAALFRSRARARHHDRPRRPDRRLGAAQVLPSLQTSLYETIAKRDAWLYDGLTRAGSCTTSAPDGSGIHTCYLRRGAGYYIETGASRMIIDGRIQLAAGAGIEPLSERSLTLDNGTELPADLIVFATGYGDMNQWAAQLISPEVAQNVGRSVGPRVRHQVRPRAVGRRAAQHVEADARAGAVVSRGKSDAEPALLVVFGVAVEGTRREEQCERTI
jgi:putative flavoprotein involved in K+ transport